MVIGYSDQGLGWNGITFVTDSEAWVIYAPGRAGNGKVFVTHDAGLVWDVVPL